MGTKERLVFEDADFCFYVLKIKSPGELVAIRLAIFVNAVGDDFRLRFGHLTITASVFG